MNKKLLTTSALALLVSMGAHAQRFTDQLDRGLVAVKTTSGVYCSWRIQADEYYDVKYNLYRDGMKVNSEPLLVSNYTDASGSTSSTYTVKAVVGGVEQAASKAASVFAQNYKEVKIQYPSELKSTYIPNDACCADVDGDGELEILMKFDNSQESAQLYPKNGPTINGVETKEYSMLACLKQDGTVLWWVNCGPNMGDFQNNEQNIVGYDWDMDGKAEVVMRLEEGSTVHMADGTTYTIGANGKNGTAWTNYRSPKSGSSIEWFTYYGKEFLWYCEGATGKPYQCIDYPLQRLESGETDLSKAWGDGYGHRSNKHFFGAPYLDGKHPSIFIGRGIYTRHKFIAYDVDPSTHALKVRWKWTNNQAGSPWYGQGYHNYTIADVDWDGRDEIVWGSMVIDDNGKGLSTTGLGHGDAQHVGDFNPYIHGQEVFACNESQPANNYRDATTSKIYYRLTGSSDAGRALAGNFYNTVPGAIGNGAHDTPISTVTNDHVSLNTTGLGMNFRIYWDGDLQEECFNGTTVSKPGVGDLITFPDVYSNNGSKATPCFQGDVFGDWREEVIERTADNNLRIYTTTTPTKWRNYSLWYDHQYRNAMVWQPCGYNQPPHASYFLGELEGITIAPPPLTTTGRTEVSSTIGSDLNGKHALLDATSDATVSVASGASPAIFTDNAPSWVQGSAASECTTKETGITYTYYTHTLTGNAFTGSTQVVKQGDGTLVLPNVTQTYTGKTDVWAGTLQFDGTMESSPVWLNRFAELNSNGGNFKGGIKADYGSVIRPGGKDNVGTLTASTLELGFGAIVEFEVQSTDKADLLKVEKLKLETKDWENGPEYLAPRFKFVLSSTIEAGTYKIAEVGSVEGNVSDIVLTDLNGHKASLSYADGVLSLQIAELREPTSVVWTGNVDNQWNFAEKSNFKKQSDGEADVFITGDNVIFDDNANSGQVVLAEDVSPASVTFDNSTLVYNVSGDKAIAGTSSITKKGTAVTTISNVNSFKGSVNVNEGILSVSNLGVENGNNNGSLGHYSNPINLNGGTLRTTTSMSASHPVTIGEKGGDITINAGNLLTLTSKITGTNNVLTKSGSGTLVLPPTANYGKLVVGAGEVISQESNGKHGYPTTVELHNATLRDADNFFSYSTQSANVDVPEGYKASWYLDSRCSYTGTLTGSGTLGLYVTSTRCDLNGNWAQFAGNMTIYSSKSGSYDPVLRIGNSNGMKNASVTVSCPVTNQGNNFEFGNLAGTGLLDGTGTWTIGALGKDVTYSGVINGGKFIKTGDGLWTLKAAQSKLGGQSTVNGGVLNLNMPTVATACLGNYPLYVSGSGTLAGRATLYSIYVNNGGTLRPGYYYSAYSYGAMKATNGIYCKAGSKVKFFLRNANGTDTSLSYLVSNSGLNISGDIVVEALSSLVFKEGDSFVLWKAKSFSGTPTSLTLPELPAGLEWDTSSLYQATGILKVVVPTGISHLSASDRFDGTVYTTSGVKVGCLSTTKATMKKDIKAMGVPAGVYVIRVKGESVKVIVQ